MRTFIVGVFLGMSLAAGFSYAQQGWGQNPQDMLNSMQQYQTQQQLQQFLQQQQFQQPLLPLGRPPC